ncbi:hypothetical protein HanXRQr2_Chr03g0120671 [Helianthus annuus]|uniref:Uncharacterized protein n=1 Tax=Helianthus annuus TaxID=4232 RepID=A0A9K3JHE7_HELAN|nr:hypothetical protein HanXRQr2_Chr03g0120671 [Helianthus annuus]
MGCWLFVFTMHHCVFCRHEIELAAAANHPLPDDDDGAYEYRKDCQSHLQSTSKLVLNLGWVSLQ